MFTATALVAGTGPAAAVPASAAGLAFRFPAPAGTQWQVAGGYNTATHSMADGGDPYALDIVRTDAPTADTPVLAPVDGTIGFVESSNARCIGIRTSDRFTVMMCHLNPLASVQRGMTVTRGMQLATVAKAGDAANNGLSHIHFAVSQPSGTHDWGMGTTVPFSGRWALEGQDMPATTAPDAYAGVAFTSTNSVNHAPTVAAGADIQVQPGEPVTLTAHGADRDGDPLTYVWSQSSGPTVQLSPSGASVSFAAPDADGAQLTFTAAAVDPGALFGYDSVTVTVNASAPTTGGASSASTGGVILERIAARQRRVRDAAVQRRHDGRAGGGGRLHGRRGPVLGRRRRRVRRLLPRRGDVRERRLDGALRERSARADNRDRDLRVAGRTRG